MGAYGQFEEVAEAGEETMNEQGVVVRARMPRKGEFIGVIMQRFGGNRMEVQTTDGKKRNCRVPGRFKRSLWLRPRDVVLVQPWSYDDKKGDIMYKYPSSVVQQFRKKGMFDAMQDVFR